MLQTQLNKRQVTVPPTESSASLSGRSAAPGPAVEPRISGNAFRRPVLLVAAKTTGSTSVISDGLHSII